MPTTIAYLDLAILDHWKFELTSHVTNAEAPVLNKAMKERIISALGLPDDERRVGENFPMWGPLEGLPPAYLPMEEFDPISDRGFLYAKLLKEAGVKTRTDYYRGF